MIVVVLQHYLLKGKLRPDWSGRHTIEQRSKDFQNFLTLPDFFSHGS